MGDKSFNILIVDDDPNIRKTFGKILELKGYDIEGVGTASEALASAKARFFNIAFIDIRLADASGLEVLKSIKEINEDTVAIMVTAYASLASSIEAMNKGAYSYITKPVNMDRVLIVIDRALEQQRLSMENKRLLKQLQQKTWGLEKANEALRSLYKELEESSKKLQALDQMKSDFVSHVSHELRTPLTTMREANAQLLDGLKGPLNEGQQRFLEISQRSVDRLTRIISSLLDMGRLEAGKMQLERKSTDITSLAREVIKSLIPQADQKRIKLKDKMPPRLPEIFVDPDRIREVFTNLVANSLKYTKEGGSVVLTAEQKKGILEVSVADTGIGISPEHLEKVFNRFERVAKVPIPGVGGAGLGLPICKELLDLHRGKIWVESEAGKGSKFSFSLPIYKAADFLQDYLGQQIQDAKEQHTFLSLIMVNIENLAQLRKKWGAKMIEELEEQLKDLVAHSTRGPMDEVFKYKEGMFAVILLGMPKESALAVQKRLETAAAKHNFKLKDKVIELSLKFKEVTYPVDGQTAGELLENAKDIISRR